ncbi:MAG TPA: hypothetical protein VIR98_03385 [Candidatus Paceibacterota bacterium]|jgi:hypothetical protein
MKTDMTLEKQILERIKTRGLKPVPKGVFQMRDFILWTLLGVLAAALSVGIGMIIFMVAGADFQLFEKLGLSSSEKIAYSIPYFWIIATLVIAVVAYVNFRQTRRGYRIATRQVIMIAGLVAAGLGTAAYAFGIADKVDKAASENIPLYNAVTPLNTNAWLDPTHGLLSGTVREKDSEESFTLRDADSVLWTVDASDAARPEGFEFHPGDRMKLIGTKTGDDQFKAVEIGPR